MRDNDAILALLGDIKELLYGIFLLILAGILCLMGMFLWGIIGAMLLIMGLFVGLAGFVYARHGFRHHEVVENEDQTTGTPNS